MPSRRRELYLRRCQRRLDRRIAVRRLERVCLRRYTLSPREASICGGSTRCTASAIQPHLRQLRHRGELVRGASLPTRCTGVGTTLPAQCAVGRESSSSGTGRRPTPTHRRPIWPVATTFAEHRISSWRPFGDRRPGNLFQHDHRQPAAKSSGAHRHSRRCAATHYLVSDPSTTTSRDRLRHRHGVASILGLSREPRELTSCRCLVVRQRHANVYRGQRRGQLPQRRRRCDPLIGAWRDGMWSRMPATDHRDAGEAQTLFRPRLRLLGPPTRERTLTVTAGIAWQGNASDNLMYATAANH